MTHVGCGVKGKTYKYLGPQVRGFQSPSPPCRGSFSCKTRGESRKLGEGNLVLKLPRGCLPPNFSLLPLFIFCRHKDHSLSVVPKTRVLGENSAQHTRGPCPLSCLVTSPLLTGGPLLYQPPASKDCPPSSVRLELVRL